MDFSLTFFLFTSAVRWTLMAECDIVARRHCMVISLLGLALVVGALAMVEARTRTLALRVPSFSILNRPTSATLNS